MTKYEEHRNRFLQESPQKRIGHIGSNMARVDSFSENKLHLDGVRYVIEQNRFYIQWTLPDTTADKALRVIEADKLLCDWQNNLESIWNDDNKRDTMRREARNWSNKLLRLSGLLYQEPNETRMVAEPKPKPHP